MTKLNSYFNVCIYIYGGNTHTIVLKTMVFIVAPVSSKSPATGNQQILDSFRTFETLAPNSCSCCSPFEAPGWGSRRSRSNVRHFQLFLTKYYSGPSRKDSPCSLDQPKRSTLDILPYFSLNWIALKQWRTIYIR